MESAYYTRLDGTVIEGHQIQEEFWALERELERLRISVDEMWGCVEDVAVGRKLECATCGESKPCCCDKGCYEKQG